MSDLKQCITCKEWKPRTEFNKNKRKPDGYQGYCRECQKSSNQRYLNSEKGKRVRQAYAESERGKEVTARAKRKYCHSQKNKDAQIRYNQTKKGKAKSRRNSIRQRQKFPQRYRAGKAVNHAVERGRMPRVTTQKCKDCGKKAREYHHYLGYKKEHWLDVIPLCIRCHKSRH